MPMGGGGPHAAYLACRDEFKRTCPAGWSASASTRTAHPAYRLALQTREQHIRREKATSQHLHRAGAAGGDRQHVRGLPRAGGPEAHRAARGQLHRGAGRRACASWACTVRSDTAFDTLCRRHRRGAPPTSPRARVAAGMNLRRFPEWGDTMLGIALDETTTRDDIARAVAAVRQAGPGAARHRRRSSKGIEPLIPRGAAPHAAPS